MLVGGTGLMCVDMQGWPGPLHPTIPLNQNKTLVGINMNLTAHNSFVFYSCISSMLGNVVFQNFPMITQDLSRRSIATSGESASTYPRRPKAEAFSNAVDVVERLRDSTDPSTERTAP